MNTTLRKNYPDDLTALHDLDDWQVAEGETDPRGMELIGANGQTIGEIDTLLASPTTERAHFAVVKSALRPNEQFAVPLDEVRFDQDERRAYAPYLETQFAAAPVYAPGARDYDLYAAYWLEVGEREPERDEFRQNRERHKPADETFQLRREELHPHKQAVKAGEVEVHKEVVTETQTIEVPVTREEVVVTRRPVADGRAVDHKIEEDGEEIRIPVMQEQVNVEKRTVVAEEVEIGKRHVQGKQTVSGQVKHEEVRVDTDGDVSLNRNGR